MTNASPEPAAEGRVSGAAERRPRIGVTMGDPSGIGPEVVLKAVAEPDGTFILLLPQTIKPDWEW